MQSVLLSMIASLGSGYQYMGIATPSTDPGTPDQRVFYLAWTAGTYSNFNSITVNTNEVVILRYDTSWHKDLTGICSVNYIATDLGYGKSEFPITAGESHSSLIDKIVCDIPAGAKYIIDAQLLDGAAVSPGYSLYVLYDGDSSGTYITTYQFGRRTLTASRRIKELRFYLNGPYVTASGTAKFTLYTGLIRDFLLNTDSINVATINSLLLRDALSNSTANIVLDETNKTVTIKSAGCKLCLYNKSTFNLTGGGNDFVMSYKTADAPIGAWMLSRDAVLAGSAITMSAETIYFAAVDSAAFNKDIKLFGTYNGYIMPVGLIGPYLLQRQIDALKTSIPELRNELLAKIGDLTTEFTLTPGTAHSSTADRILCDIPAGAKYTISSELLDGAVATVFALYLWYEGASSGTVISNYDFGTTFTRTAARRIVKMGFYVQGGNITTAGTARIHLLSNFAYDNAVLTDEINKLKAQDVIAIDALSNVQRTVIVDEAAKTVTIKKQGIRIKGFGTSVTLSGSDDFVMSYKTADAENGGWLLLRSALINGGNIELNSTNVFYANIGTTKYNNNILLFATYYNRLIPVGLLASALMEVNLLNPMRQNAFQSTYNFRDVVAKNQEFCAMLNNTGIAETFIFMTDPHLMGTNNTYNADTFKDYISFLQKCYNQFPVDWMICGGDWLNSGDYQVNACWKLGYVDATMRKMFKHYFPMFGNHDSNYQGTISADDSTRGDLTKQTLVNLMFRPYGKMYYEFAGNQTRFFIFDTELDWNIDMNSYKWEQIAWFAEKLLTNTSAHIVIGMHIYKQSGNITPLAENIQALAGAFNSHGSVTLNGQTYDFTNATGKIACIISGHTHNDALITDGNIPVWVTCNMQNGGTPTFDVILIDYTANEMKSVRIGSGSNRILNLA